MSEELRVITTFPNDSNVRALVAAREAEGVIEVREYDVVGWQVTNDGRVWPILPSNFALDLPAGMFAGQEQNNVLVFLDHGYGGGIEEVSGAGACRSRDDIRSYTEQVLAPRRMRE